MKWILADNDMTKRNIMNAMMQAMRKCLDVLRIQLMQNNDRIYKTTP